MISVMVTKTRIDTNCMVIFFFFNVTVFLCWFKNLKKNRYQHGERSVTLWRRVPICFGANRIIIWTHYFDTRRRRVLHKNFNFNGRNTRRIFFFFLIHFSFNIRFFFVSKYVSSIFRHKLRIIIYSSSCGNNNIVRVLFFTLHLVSEFDRSLYTCSIKQSFDAYDFIIFAWKHN